MGGGLCGRSLAALDAERAICPPLDGAGGGRPCPGEEVGVMFHDGGHHDVFGGKAETVGEMVERFGGIAADDGHIVAPGAPGEGQRRAASILVRGCGELGLVAGATVDARVPGDELVDPAMDRRQAGGGSGGVEGKVGPLTPSHAGYECAVTNQRNGRPSHEVCSPVSLTGALRWTSSRSQWSAKRCISIGTADRKSTRLNSSHLG